MAAGSVGDKSSEVMSSVQPCQSMTEALAEWRSSEQVENGTPSTSPPYWDSDDDDCGQKPSELYGKFTWKIENFSQISKRELRSNAFEVGGYKWYILIYPQGCDVCNHLSLFLCVANHDKLLPGWSHFAQFTIAVVNKDPKKSKYSDTLHRFWKKEHDWGWKKFMELSKVLDGFIVSDTLVIKAQVQVIREKADRPFRCLDCQYRRELVRVYLTNVEHICRRFFEEKRGKLLKLIEDKERWSSFREFWSAVDNSKDSMDREKSDAILKVVVKHFFVEKEVTSTLVMDSLYSGMKALECRSTSKRGKAKCTEEKPAPIVRLEKDMFVLVDDVVLLLERAALEPLPPKDEKGPQNRTKDGSSGEDFNKESIERDERRLTELGRRTLEIFVLEHIFSNKIEVAHQESVALKRQEELIREEEAAGQADWEEKAKRAATEKEKRAKKKQSKHRRNNRKGKDKVKDEKLNRTVQDKQQGNTSTDDIPLVDAVSKLALSMPDTSDTLDDVTDVSDTGDDFCGALPLQSEDRDTSPVNCDTDTSEIQVNETSDSGTSVLPLENARPEKNTYFIDDSSSTCSTDSVPSVVMNVPRKGSTVQTSPSRRKIHCGKEAEDCTTGRACDFDNQPSEPLLEAGSQYDTSQSRTATEGESEAVLSLKDQIKMLQQHLVEKEEEVVTLQKKLDVKVQVDGERPRKQSMGAEASSSPSSTCRNPPSTVHPKAVSYQTAEPVSIREASSNSHQEIEKATPVRISSPQDPSIFKRDAQSPAYPSKYTVTRSDRTTAYQAVQVSRPSSAPLVPDASPSAPVVGTAHAAHSLARSVSSAGRFNVPQSYKNAITGKTIDGGSFGCTPKTGNPSPVTSLPPYALSSPKLSPQSSPSNDQRLGRSGFTFGSVSQDLLRSQPPWISDNFTTRDTSNFQDLDTKDHASTGFRTYFADELPPSTSSCQAQGVSAEEFPHLHMINCLLDEEYNIGRAVKTNAVFPSPSNGHHRSLNRQLTFPGDLGMSADMDSSSNSCKYDHPSSYHDDGMHRFNGAPFELRRDLLPQPSLSAYGNGQMDGGIQHRWPVSAGHISSISMMPAEGDVYPYQLPEYANTARGVNGYSMYPPSNRF